VIYDECPWCGCEHLRDCLSGPDRHLRQSCYECGWVGEAREPETRNVTLVKRLPVHNGAINYEIFDCYGQPYTRSSGYSSEEVARKELEEELERLNQREGGAPWVGVLWPANVVAFGELVR
jgi:hypothetical protein